MVTPRILFMGTPAFAVPSLEALVVRPDLCQVQAVITQPDRPAGRGRKLTASPVKLAAQAHDLPVLQPTKMKSEETWEALAQYKPDLMVVAAYGRILPPRLLELPQRGCVNVHASILPRHRGASPIAHAIMAGDPEVGVSIMQMDEGLDTGPVHGVSSIPLQSTHNRGNLTEELALLGAQALIEALPGILDGTSQPTAQEDERSTYAPLLTKQDGLLDFSKDALTLSRRVRGLNPWPGAYAMQGDKRTLFSVVSPAEGAGRPGEVLQANSQGVLVACQSGALRLEEVRPSGKKLMAATAWAAGRGIQEGDLFNSSAE